MTKQPNSRRNLDMAIHRMAASDKDFVKLRALLANAIVGQMLPNGAVKGGTALKFRFGDAATRFTTDLDAARQSDLDAFAEKLEASLSSGWNGFAGRLVPRSQARPAHVPPQYVMRPFDIKIDYRGKPWCTVLLEVGHNELGDADEPERMLPPDIARMFRELGFPDPDPLPLMPLHHQIAQKLHGASEPGSKRAHDLIDLQIIMRGATVDLTLTRRTCERLFAYRAMQPWPSVITKNEGWETLYDAQVLPPPVLQSVDEAVAWANELVTTIANA